MLTGGFGTHGVSYNDNEKLWVVSTPSPQWAGWVHWYKNEIGKKFFPDRMTVLSEWPPSTQEGADLTAKWLSDIRDSKFGKDPLPIGGAPVPRHPRPWTGGK